MYQDTPEERTPSRRRHMVGHGSLPALVECSAWGGPVVLIGGAAASPCQVCLSGMYISTHGQHVVVTYLLFQRTEDSSSVEVAAGFVVSGMC